jgi:hypothetical protein
VISKPDVCDTRYFVHSLERPGLSSAPLILGVVLGEGWNLLVLCSQKVSVGSTCSKILKSQAGGGQAYTFTQFAIREAKYFSE